jgi:hypothetical protein
MMEQEAVAPAGVGGRDLKSPSASEAPDDAVVRGAKFCRARRDTYAASELK